MRAIHFPLWSLLVIFALMTVPLMAVTAAQESAKPDEIIPGPSSPETTSGVPIARFLRQDGTLDLPPEGIEGGIDPGGYYLVSGPGEAPRFAASPDPSAAGDECWDARFYGRGVNDTVSVVAGDGTNLYAAGSFTKTASGSAVGIARWNGSAWSPLEPGLSPGVSALAWDGANLYAGGHFVWVGSVQANYIARWDGAAWHALGSGMSSYVRALAWRGGYLYAGGDFTTAGGATANRVARWDGASWSALGSGMDDGTVYDLVWGGSTLFAGGTFTSVDGSPCARVAQWDGSSWSPLGTGLNNYVRALAWDGVDLFAGGAFTTAGGTAANRVARWDGSAWYALGSGTNNTVFELATDGSNLYAGGYFTQAGGGTVNYIARWNGSSWNALGTGASGQVHALFWNGSALIAGGDFISAGGVPVGRIARWDGASWSSLPSGGMGGDEEVQALAWDGSGLFAGGRFTMMGDDLFSYIARWNGVAWSSLGQGASGYVYALAWTGSDLYAGGGFTYAGGTLVNRIARWDGSAWQPVDTGVSGVVYALVWTGSDLYAGGNFSSAGGVSAANVARWDGASWSPLGSGTDGSVWALAWDGSNLYAAGDFATAGGAPATRVARWDGSAWSALGSGMEQSVRALAAGGGYLYAGGYFDTAGGTPVGKIARWNGSSWSNVGTGTDGYVFSLTYGGGTLYAGGNFTTAGGVPANRVAKWNGTSWSAFGSGMDDGVRALAIAGADLYAGGRFASAGGKGASMIAHHGGPAVTADPQDDDTCAGGSASFSTAASGSGLNYQWQVDQGGGFFNVPAGAPYVGTTTATLTIDPAAAEMNGYQFRCTVTSGVCPGISHSDPAVLTVYSPGAFAPLSPADGSASCSTDRTLTWQASAGAVGYTVYLDGSPVPGCQDIAGTQCTLSGLDDDATYTWFVRAEESHGCVRDSAAWQFTVHPNAYPTIDGPSPACGSGLLSTQAFSSYQWYRNGTKITGATAPSYAAPAPGTYTVQAVNGYGCVGISSGFSIQSNPSPAIAESFPGCGSMQLSAPGYSAYQWTRDGAAIPGATGSGYTATRSGTYAVQVTDAFGCSGGSSALVVDDGVPASVSGPNANLCPATVVNLTAPAGYLTYQWTLNGTPIAGAVGAAYAAGVTGEYAVTTADGLGCELTSSPHMVFVDFCAGSEVSPLGAVFPLRVVKDAASSTGYYLYFQRLDSLDGYNIYEGDLGALYSHGGAPGNDCAAVVSDLDTGEMRAEVLPSSGNRYYLVSAFGAGMEGPSGFDGEDLEIPPAQSTCPP